MTGKLVCFTTPDVTQQTFTHDETQKVFEARAEIVANLPAMVTYINEDMPNEHGWTRTTIQTGYKPRVEHGIVRFDIINKWTGSASYDVDTIRLDKEDSSPFVRSGLVRPNGRAVGDDQGEYYPLGETFFWGVRGYKFERERMDQNLAWLKKWHWDYERVLAAVGWQNNEIDPEWPDYQDQLAGYIDNAYDVHGQRTQITVWGGYAGRDPISTTQKVIEVIKGREHKIQHLEAVNEWFNNLPDIHIVRQMSSMLMQTGCMVVSSCASPPSDAEAQRMTNEGCANTNAVHLDRTQDDLDWRFVRQPWDIKNYEYPTSNQEGKGPASSVSGNSNPLQLAQYRAVTIVCRGAMFVLHNGAGIYGVDHVHPGTGQHRTANLWEMPRIEEIMAAVRGVDTLLPAGMPHGVCANDGWAYPKHPLSSVDFWAGSNLTGVNKNYAVRDLPDGRWVCAPSGVRAEVDGEVGGRFEAAQACHVKAFDTLTGELVKEADLALEEEFTLPGRRDSMQAYVVVGEAR